MERIKIINGRGEKLAALVFQPADEPCLVVIICHGFRGGKENGGRIFKFAKRLNQRGAAVIAFDFGGSGESEGLFFDMTLSSQADDLRAVIDYAGQRFAAPMVLLGRSFGGSTVLVEGAGDERIAGFILWSTPVFMEETFAAMLPDEYNRMKSGQVVAIRDDFGSYQLGPGLAADLARHNMNHYLQAIGKRPVLLVHAEDDELVSAENARYMQKQLTNASLNLVEEAGHRFLDKTAVREDMTLAWLEELFLQ
ncbi:MAG TPA: alpha/beta fold hydrolase [Syntrophomonas sp.]|nr:alpha/beta fold hydrolase [Syntrophomonas sp.]